MTGRLPDQTPDKDKYSEADLQHLVAREVMKLRMSDFEKRISGNEEMIKDMFSRLEAGQEVIRQIVSRGTDQIRECRRELERDISDNYIKKSHAVSTFATKEQVKDLEGQVKVLTAKIVTGVTVAFTIVQLAFQVWGK